MRCSFNASSFIRVISFPFIKILPEVGFIKPMMSLSNVDFPLPDAPNITKVSSLLICKFTSRKICLLPND